MLTHGADGAGQGRGRGGQDGGQLGGLVYGGTHHQHRLIGAEHFLGGGALGGGKYTDYLFCFLFCKFVRIFFFNQLPHLWPYFMGLGELNPL